MQDKKQIHRISWIDDCRAFAMFSVVFGHVALDLKLTNNGLPPYYILAYNMPLFVILSGYCNTYSFSKIDRLQSLWCSVRKTVYRIGLPSVSFGLLNLLVSSVRIENGEFLFGFKTFLVSILLLSFIYLYKKTSQDKKKWMNLLFIALIVGLNLCGSNARICSLWFLPFIFFTQTIALVSAYVANKNNSLNYIITFSIVMLLLIFALSKNVTFLLELASFWIVGTLIYKQWNCLYYLSRYLKCLIVFVLFGISLYVTGTQLVNMDFYHKGVYELDMLNLLLRYTISSMLCFSIIYVFYKISQRYSLWSYTGTLTIAVYPIHWILLYIMRLTPINDFLSHSLLMSFVVAIILYVFSSYIAHIINENQTLSFIFMGNEKNKKI